MSHQLSTHKTFDYLIIGGDGSLGGYRWGLERKRVLLDQEQARKSA